MNATPETNAMVAADQHHLDDDNFFPATVYWRMCDLARTLERERDEARAMASDMRNQFEKASTARLFFPWENTAISGGIHHPTNQ
ncbi:MAG: hypothetical protein RLZZ214_722 [Verrucomicrobiota bacterium]|jgi:uncharacterized protein YifN (PemK superfamily)